MFPPSCWVQNHRIKDWKGFLQFIYLPLLKTRATSVIRGFWWLCPLGFQVTLRMEISPPWTPLQVFLFLVLQLMPVAIFMCTSEKFCLCLLYSHSEHTASFLSLFSGIYLCYVVYYSPLTNLASLYHTHPCLSNSLLYWRPKKEPILPVGCSH